MTKNQKPLREMKRDTRRVVNDALASLRDLAEEINEDERVDSRLRYPVSLAISELETAKWYGKNWWKNS